VLSFENKTRKLCSNKNEIKIVENVLLKKASPAALAVTQFSCHLQQLFFPWKNNSFFRDKLWYIKLRRIFYQHY
jgi:hypothetical protein